MFPDRSPRIRHRNELTERDWENAVQGPGKLKGMFSLRDRLKKERGEKRGKGRKARKRKGKGASLPAKRAVMVGSSSDFNFKFPHEWKNFDLPKLMPEEYISFDACIMVVSY